MALPNISIINMSNTIAGPPEDGNLLYKYSPFKNLKVIEPDGVTDLTDLTISADLAEIDINSPLEINTEPTYDTSINLVVNDRKNPLKLVNSRFYLTSSSTYNIADRKGNLDTNIYTEQDFKIEAGLIKTVRSVISLDFLGIFDGGKMPIGNYTFYFKLADADGNESDFVSESGKVVCHIGAINNPKSIRGGVLNENSEKSIKFRLNNLDLGYDYIIVYYTRSTGDGDTQSNIFNKIEDKYKINNLNTEITITGYENHVEIDNVELNQQFSYFSAVKSTTNCQNITFAGNVSKNNDIYSTLEKYSLLITPKLSTDWSVGFLTKDYVETRNQSVGYEYYNVKNIYYRLGYWWDIYRFGIVYILNDYTLSPVFNIRGVKELTPSTVFKPLTVESNIGFDENYIIEGSSENTKGVLKINQGNSSIFRYSNIKPTGLGFDFTGDVIEGIPEKRIPGLKDLTKGFFFVRQKRIPSILSQGLVINSSIKGNIPVVKDKIEVLLSGADKPRLESRLLSLSGGTYFQKNVLISPEAALKTAIFNNFFNSSEFRLYPSKLQTPSILEDTDNFTYYTNDIYTPWSLSTDPIDTNLLLVESGIELVNNHDVRFSSQAGDASSAWKHVNPELGSIEDFSTDTSKTDKEWSRSNSVVRGIFNTFIGSTENFPNTYNYYDIYQKNYDFDNNWKDYFRIRYNDASPFSSISDRYRWTTTLENEKSISWIYRGDCYVSTYTHRMLWNFTDPDLPTNHRIIDLYTWYKNYRVKTVKIKAQTFDTSDEALLEDSTSQTSGTETDSLSYKKVLPLFTWRFTGDDYSNFNFPSISALLGVITPESRHFKKFSEINGTFGSEKMNRPDINAVPLGHWITFKICSNINLAMRDIDFSRPTEEAIFKRKRGFHPLYKNRRNSSLPESSVINSGISSTLGDKYYFEIPDVPFIKTNFSNRIHYSDVLQEGVFKNGNRVFRAQNYQDYTTEYGALVKLIEWYGSVMAIMEHGVVLIPVTERAMMTNEEGQNVYINTDEVLPKNPRVLSNTFGSIWPDSILKTSRYVYGIDTVAKKIWRTNGEQFENISDMKIQKFLNDNIHLKESDKISIVGKNFIKSHYNAFKYDILFTFKYDTTSWNLCWNELTERWVTRYTWFPEFSENINNIFYTFANTEILSGEDCSLYKHGFAGTEEQLGNILPTYWYGKQHPFEFEFVVIGVQGVQKIFDNLKIISNASEPESFYYEVVGEGFNWKDKKSDIYTFTSDADFVTYLQDNPTIKKVPYIMYQDPFIKDRPTLSRDITISENNKTREKNIEIYQKGIDIKTNGRIKGNMQYVEDSWDIQIQPITFKYAYLSDDTLAFSNSSEMRIRDKYIKIRVRYDGTKYSIINALRTFFTISYA